MGRVYNTATKIYNAPTKLEFIEEVYDDESQTTLKYLFRRTFEKEHEIDKDIYQFTEDELVDLFYFLRFRSFSAFSVFKHYMSRYLDWAESKNLSNLGYNIIKYTAKFKDPEKFLDKIAMNEKYVTKEQLLEIFEKCKNHQDRALLLAPFEGIYGKKMYELASMKMENVDKNNNTIKLTDKDGSERIVYASEELIHILELADKQKVYENYGNYFAENNDTLIDSEYVIKVVSKRGNAMLSYGGGYRRLKTIAEEYGNRYITFVNLKWSGIFHYVKKYREETNGVDTEENLNKVAKKYNMDVYTIKHKIEKIL